MLKDIDLAIKYYKYMNKYAAPYIRDEIFNEIVSNVKYENKKYLKYFKYNVIDHNNKLSGSEEIDQNNNQDTIFQIQPQKILNFLDFVDKSDTNKRKIHINMWLEYWGKKDCDLLLKNIDIYLSKVKQYHFSINYFFDSLFNVVLYCYFFLDFSFYYCNLFHF